MELAKQALRTFTKPASVVPYAKPVFCSVSKASRKLAFRFEDQTYRFKQSQRKFTGITVIAEGGVMGVMYWKLYSHFLQPFLHTLPLTSDL